VSPELAELERRLDAERAQTSLAVQLRQPLLEASSAFSYVRTRGCLAAADCLSRCCERGADGAAHRRALRQLLRTPGRLPVDLVALLLGGALASPLASAETAALRSPPGGEADEAELRASALLLRGLCLLDAATRDAAGGAGGVAALLSRAEEAGAAPASGGGGGAGSLRAVLLSALGALLLHSPANQSAFTRLRGAPRVASWTTGRGAKLGEPERRCPAAQTFLHTLLARGLLSAEAAKAAEAALGAEVVAAIFLAESGAGGA